MISGYGDSIRQKLGGYTFKLIFVFDLIKHPRQHNAHHNAEQKRHQHIEKPEKLHNAEKSLVRDIFDVIKKEGAKPGKQGESHHTDKADVQLGAKIPQLFRFKFGFVLRAISGIA